MPSSRGRTSSSPRRPARSCTTTRKSCWRTATAGSARSPRTSRSTRRIGEDELPMMPATILPGVVFLAELLLVVGAWVIGPGLPQAISSPIPGNLTNTEALGRVLYTQYVYYFQASGVVLLVAMIGAIVLTLRHKPNIKRQNISDQVARTRETAIDIVKVQPGQGL